MVASLRSTWALFLGVALIMVASGLQGTLLGVRAAQEAFPTAVTGLIMSAYFGGFLVGSLLVPRMVEQVGHVRVFAALASLASVAVLIHAAVVEPWTWFAMRLLTGFASAGLYVVAESWLNDRATNESRGQVLAVYMIIVLAGIGCGQLLLNVADPQGYIPFIICSVLVSLGLDAQANDPLGVLKVSTEGFGRIGAAIAGLGLPTVLVQEGGYLCDGLDRNLVSFLQAFQAAHKVTA